MTDTALFSSWHGRYSDSPRAISEALRHRSSVRQVWLLDDDAPPTPDGVERIATGSPEEVAELEAARWIVSNDVLPTEFAKREDSVYLQTWHGTPLKRIGFDVRHPTFPDAEYHYSVELVREVARWDAMLSPNPHSSRILRSAFRFDGPMLETGYPRNDVLLSGGRDAIRTRVREALAVDHGMLAILYAPTWRDDFTMRFELDFGAVHSAFGDDAVLFVRAHGLTARRTRLEEQPGVRDVTRWPEIADLYLAADVLVTDYSSAMVDFAVTRKPQIFYFYDLADYRERVRGFYVEPEQIVPGPIVDSTEALIATLQELDSVSERHAERYERFVDRFCPLDDGRATDRVLEAIFGD